MSEKARHSSGPVTLQLKIGLRDTDPLVRRRLLLPGSMALEKFHSTIQAAMGWDDCHLHVFEISEKTYGHPNDEVEEDEQDLDENGVRLHRIVADGDHV